MMFFYPEPRLIPASVSVYAVCDASSNRPIALVKVLLCSLAFE